MNFKYKVGDRVRVLDGTGIPDYFCGWTRGMNRYVGHTFRVLSQTGESFAGYKLDDGGGFTYDERFLEPAEKKAKPRIVIYTDKKNPGVVIARDTETGKIGSAKCSPQDTFDFYTGAELAMKRMIENDPSPKKKFKIGDYVIGNRLANVYGITKEKTVWKIYSPPLRACLDGEIYVKADPESISGFYVTDKCFDPYTGPIFDGEVVCIKAAEFRHFDAGKIYRIKNGVFPVYYTGLVTSVDALNERYNGECQFIEVVK